MTHRELRDIAKERSLAVPYIGEPDILVDSTTANAIFHTLNQLGSQLPVNILAQARKAAQRFLGELETTPDGDHVVMTPEQLEAMIIDAAQMSAGQVISDIGRQTVASAELERIMFELPEPKI